MATMIVDIVRELAADHVVSAVGLGVPGFVSRSRDAILFAPNLALPSRPLIERVIEESGLAAILENDANAAAWGEWRYGAAVGQRDVLLIAAGTGVGGGLVLGGQLHRGALGIAAEVGHVRLVPGGRPCGCGLRGCLDAYASGAAMTLQAQKYVAAGMPEAGALSSLCGGVPETLDGAMVTSAARAGDELAVGLLAEAGTWSGEELASLVAVLDPGLIAIGGGLGDAGELLLTPLRTAFAAHLGSARPIPTVVSAMLGNNAGLVGVADLAVCDGNSIGAQEPGRFRG